MTINPSALLFNQINQNGGIQNNSIAFAGKDPAGLNAFGLRVPDGKSLLLVGGNVSMDGGRLNANGGRVELGGLAGTGTVELNEDINNLRLNFPENVAKADVSLINRANVNVRAGGSGNIVINAYNLNMAERSSLIAGIDSELGSIDTVAGDVEINATRSISLNNNSFITSAVLPRAVGKGGDINITTGSIAITNGARLNTVTFGQGDAGSVNINARDTVSFDEVNSNTFQTGVFSVVQPRAVGKGGDINIITRSLSVKNGAELNASTLGQGDAGNITIQARDTVSFDGVYDELASGASSIVNTRAVGKAGDINITTGSLLITNGAVLTASTLGQGDGGNVTIFASDFVSFNGLDSGVLNIVESGAVGNGGNVTIYADTFSLTDGARLDTRTQGQGRAGNITVHARDSVSLAGIPTKIVTAVGAGGVGKGGNLNIKATSLSLNDGAQLITAIYAKYFDTTDNSTQSAGRGDAGNTNIEATGLVTIAGSKDGIPSGIFSLVSPEGIGNGGNITIYSDSLSLTDGGIISATTSGEGNAGTLKINTVNAVSISGTLPTTGNSSGLFVSSSGLGTAGDIEVFSPKIRLDNQGRLTAESASGNGGDINLQTDLLFLRRGAQITTSAGTAEAGGNGGNINIDASSGFIVAVPNENSDITANAYTGTGGRVDIKANGIYGIGFRESPTDLSDITASSRFGTQGTVELNTPDIDPNSGLVNLPTVPVDTQVAQTCQAGGTFAKSSFTITGRGGLPPNPTTDILPPDLVHVDWISLNPSTREGKSPPVTIKPTATPKPIVEATGWVMNAKGEVQLIANAPATTPHASWQNPVSCRDPLDVSVQGYKYHWNRKPG
ncbi:Large exoprotein involved in heme utilization or adhesion [Nostoc flagelliforme CCNUN1]|uniref:Large exoprotein involved in heme utilization or adhesion n=1 Tax=Nostoc flagelliforme CCNUN1 TaxID=2038116 RepID=A0A2K8T0D8_9NOSO|nr:Large exoprotein involved in heme utilization or adhesion [Nostoc flagelliforme CCNUN1]